VAAAAPAVAPPPPAPPQDSGQGAPGEEGGEEEDDEAKEIIEMVQLVTFGMAGETYALEIHQVEAIINLVPITRVPKAPSHIDGVINLRGEIVPVINTRRRLRLPPLETSENNQIIILSFEEEKVKAGFMVDSVAEVIRLPETSIEPPTRVSESVDIDYLKGVGKVDNTIIILLNAHRIVFGKTSEE
jgi:purine-binding chemotaxis protein CheW